MIRIGKQLTHEWGKATIYLGLPLLAYSQVCLFIFPLTLKRVAFPSQNITQNPYSSIEIAEYCSTPNTYNAMAYSLGSLAILASAAFSSHMLYHFLHPKKSMKRHQLPGIVQAFMLLTCINSTQWI
jgi:hypothetical protein